MKFSTEYYLLDETQITEVIRLIHDNFPHLTATDTTVRVNAPDGQRLSPIVTVKGHFNYGLEFRQYEAFERKHELGIYTANSVLGGGLRPKIAEAQFASAKYTAIGELKRQEISVKVRLANALEYNRKVRKINWALRLLRVEAKGHQPQLIDVEPHKAELNRIRKEMHELEQTQFVWEKPDNSDEEASDETVAVGAELADVLAIGSIEDNGSNIARTFAGIVVGAVTVAAAYAVKRGKG